MYRYLIFDLDDTLLDFHKGEHDGLVQVFKTVGLAGDQLDEALAVYQTVNRELWSAFERNEITKHTIQTTRFQRVVDQLGVAGDGIAMEKQYRRALTRNDHVFPDAEPLLKQLTAAGYTLIAGTNGETQTQYSRLALTGFDQYFDRVYISDEMGVAKPHAAFFDCIFADYPEMTKANTIMIGDGGPSDMAGGSNYGLDTLWVKGRQALPDGIVPTMTTTDLTEIPALLMR